MELESAAAALTLRETARDAEAGRCGFGLALVVACAGATRPVLGAAPVLAAWPGPVAQALGAGHAEAPAWREAPDPAAAPDFHPLPRRLLTGEDPRLVRRLGPSETLAALLQGHGLWTEATPAADRRDWQLAWSPDGPVRARLERAGRPARDLCLAVVALVRRDLPGGHALLTLELAVSAPDAAPVTLIEAIELRAHLGRSGALDWRALPPAGRPRSRAKAPPPHAMVPVDLLAALAGAAPGRRFWASFVDLEGAPEAGLVAAAAQALARGTGGGRPPGAGLLAEGALELMAGRLDVALMEGMATLVHGAPPSRPDLTRSAWAAALLPVLGLVLHEEALLQEHQLRLAALADDPEALAREMRRAVLTFRIGWHFVDVSTRTADNRLHGLLRAQLGVERLAARFVEEIQDTAAAPASTPTVADAVSAPTLPGSARPAPGAAPPSLPLLPLALAAWLLLLALLFALRQG